METLPEVLRPVPPVAAGAPLRAQAVLAAMRDMRARQRLHDLTGATHAAGWAGADGTIALLREDVGRHNALDKLVGALARHGLAAASGMVLVSSRASFEMVQKTAAAGVPVLAAVSAPPRWPCGWRKRPTSRSWASCATTTPRCTPIPSAFFPDPDPHGNRQPDPHGQPHRPVLRSHARPAGAGEGVANHIHKFWEPRMRTQLLDFLAGQPDGEAGQETLHPLVREAVLQNRDRLTPAGRKPD